MNVKRFFTLFTIIASVSLYSTASYGEIVIIVNSKSPIKNADKTQIGAVFLGKFRRINGHLITPLDQYEGSHSRDEFYKKITKKTPSQINAYWSRLIFTGKGMPPEREPGDMEVIDLVVDDPSFIGYVNAKSLKDNNMDNNINVIFSAP